MTLQQLRYIITITEKGSISKAAKSWYTPNPSFDESQFSEIEKTNKYIKDEELISKSRRAGEAVLAETVKATSAKNRGISERSDMTGFNWSEVPVILLEMGFMTNEEEDRLLSTDEYQDKIVTGIVNGLEKYFSE